MHTNHRNCSAQCCSLVSNFQSEFLEFEKPENSISYSTVFSLDSVEWSQANYFTEWFAGEELNAPLIEQENITFETHFRNMNAITCKQESTSENSLPFEIPVQDGNLLRCPGQIVEFGKTQENFHPFLPSSRDWDCEPQHIDVDVENYPFKIEPSVPEENPFFSTGKEINVPANNEEGTQPNILNYAHWSCEEVVHPEDSVEGQRKKRAKQFVRTPVLMQSPAQKYFTAMTEGTPSQCVDKVLDLNHKLPIRRSSPVFNESISALLRKISSEPFKSWKPTP